MKYLLLIAFLFLTHLTFTSCCVPKFIGLDQAKEIGNRAIERFCESKRETSPSDYELLTVKQDVGVANSEEKLAWEMTYLSHQKNGDPYIEVIIMIDQCGGTETSFWDYTQK